ncbi:hypothetical protein J2X16_004446 [Pelomonas aquatica]|uniref:MucB/RseB N-terminal domain-containing protein n=1 Tax=Pelomonas aquatica TaxID=431058 RepID=A0ABU1ZF45_9BURK|nr:hypothetical protein [Pelomonas aquatica]MDR7299078.1 hypothetical protein [Pelomonas aquatica]
MSSPARCSCTAALAALTCFTAAALPAGWTAEPADGSGVHVYRHSRGSQQAELRIYPAEAGAQPLMAWFEARRLAPLPGYRSSFKPARQASPMLVLANGEGVDARGRAVHLVRMACQRPQGGLVFAEAVLSADAGYLKQAVPEMASVLEPACVGQSAAVAPPAPTAHAKPAARAADDAPYAHVTPKGQGLKTGEIEAVLREWRDERSGMTMQVRTYYHLLLKDGSYRKGLPPVALEDFDAAAARRAEGDTWGRWTRERGQYHLVRTGSRHVNKVSADTARQPARRDEKLEGTWAVHTAYSTAWSVARSRRDIQFGHDGRFARSSGGDVVGSMGAGADAVAGSVTHDDDSSAATIGSSTAGGGSSRRRASTLPDRSGSYRLDGYTLELRYDSGRVERLPFVATADRDALYFGGEELSRVKPGKR